MEQTSLFDSGELRENEQFLSSQLITYLGNKRNLLGFIGQSVEIVKKELNKEKLSIFDVFSGSGVVARYLKGHAYELLVNDMEDYCRVLNECYLSNKSDINFEELEKHYDYLKLRLKEGYKKGFFQELYAPINDFDIKQGERVFFSSENAKKIDTIRQLIDDLPEDSRKFFLGPLITEVSVKNNTSGVFKGFYKDSKTGKGQFGGTGKNALGRILSPIELKFPIFSNYDANIKIYQKDSNVLVGEVDPVDLAYLDPPYNQHPYGSNYFMLNLLVNYKKPTDFSKVSGIPIGWNRSVFNKQKGSLIAFEKLCKETKAKYLLVSFNSEGFIEKNQMVQMLSNLGQLRVFEKKYNTFRGSRNLRNRALHVKEFLFLLKKGDK